MNRGPALLFPPDVVRRRSERRVLLSRSETFVPIFGILREQNNAVQLRVMSGELDHPNWGLDSVFRSCSGAVNYGHSGNKSII